MPYLKCPYPLPETHLFFYLALQGLIHISKAMAIQGMIYGLGMTPI